MNRDEGITVVPEWNEEASSLELYVMVTKEEDRYLCGPRVLAQWDPGTLPCNVIRAAISNGQFTEEGGVYQIVSATPSCFWGQNQSKKHRDCCDS